MTQETAYELVLKAIAALELNDKAPQKLQLCNAPARGVLDLKPREEPRCVSGDKGPMFCFIHTPNRVCRPQYLPGQAPKLCDVTFSRITIFELVKQRLDLS